MTEMAGMVVLNTEESSGMVIAKDDKDSRIFLVWSSLLSLIHYILQVHYASHL